MLQNKLSRAVFEALSDEYEQLIPECETHEFSAEFNRKMQKLISRQSKPYYKIINTFGKRVACFIIGFLAISMTTVMSVDALRTPFLNFWIDIFEKFSVVQTLDKTTPETIENIYDITSELSIYDDIYHYDDTYKLIKIYSNDVDTIIFKQDVKPNYDIRWNTEEAKIEKLIIDKHEGIYFLDNQNYHTLIWDNDDYIFSISTNISKDELIKLANSVQKVD